jgi:hypothetical protein
MIRQKNCIFAFDREKECLHSLSFVVGTDDFVSTPCASSSPQRNVVRR